MEDVDVEPHFHACADFSKFGPDAPVGNHIAGIVAPCFNAVGLGEVDGAFILEALADEYDGFHTEDFLGAHDRIQGAQSCVVADDPVGRDAALDEGMAHFFRLVVGHFAVVSGDDERLEFSGLPQARGGIDAVAEIEVFPSSDHFVRGAKDEADAGFWNLRDVRKHPSTGDPDGGDVGVSDHRHAEQADEADDDEAFHRPGPPTLGVLDRG